MASEVITLDSDEEEEETEEAAPIERPPMSFNPAHYLDLVPGAVAPVRAGLLPRPRGGRGGARLPARRPGPMLPFALFSQDQRALVVSTNPGLGVQDVNRILGEMWHTLGEEQKSVYRQRAKVIHDHKLKVWTQQQRLSALAGSTGAGGPPSITRKRRTHGYAIFNSERRHQFTTEASSLPEVTQRVAEAWRGLPPVERAVFEAKAAKINDLEDKKYKLLLQRQRQQSLAARGLGPIPGRVQAPLKIASVASMSGTASSGSGQNAAIKLPSSISISRVEPDVAVLGEKTPAFKSLQQLQANAQLSVTHSGRPQVPPPLARAPVPAARVGPMPTIARRGGRGRARGPYNPGHVLGGLGIPLRGVPATGPKRSFRPTLPTGGVKRPRIGTPPTAAQVLTGMPEIGAPASGVELGLDDTLCRLCGSSIANISLIYTLADKPAFLKMIHHCLGVSIDATAERASRFPNVACHKCCSSVVSCHKFKKVVVQGLSKLQRWAAIRLEPSTRPAQPPQPSTESILPDLDPGQSSKPAEQGDTLTSQINIKDEPLELRDEKPSETRTPAAEPGDSPPLGTEDSQDGSDEGGEDDEDDESPDPLNYLEIGPAHSIDDFEGIDEESQDQQLNNHEGDTNFSDDLATESNELAEENGCDSGEHKEHNGEDPSQARDSMDTDGGHSTADDSGSSSDSQSDDSSSTSGDDNPNVRESTDGSTTHDDDAVHEPVVEDGAASQAGEPEETVAPEAEGEEEEAAHELGSDREDEVAKGVPEDLDSKSRSLSPEDQLATAINSIQGEEINLPDGAPPKADEGKTSEATPSDPGANDTDDVLMPDEELPAPDAESESAVEAILT